MIRCISFTIALFVSAQTVHARIDHDANAESLKGDIQTILSKTDQSFWSQSSEALAKAYGPYLEQPDRAVAKVGLIAGSFLLVQGLSTEVAMKIYGTHNPFVANIKFWLDWSHNFPRLAMKFVARDSAAYARFAAKATAIDKMMAAYAARGLLVWLETKLGYRVVTSYRVLTIGVGGPITITAWIYLSLISSTEEKSKDEMGANFYESPAALVDTFARFDTVDSVYRLAKDYKGLEIQIRAFAEMLRNESGT